MGSGAFSFRTYGLAVLVSSHTSCERKYDAKVLNYSSDEMRTGWGYYEYIIFESISQHIICPVKY